MTLYFRQNSSFLFAIQDCVFCSYSQYNIQLFTIEHSTFCTIELFTQFNIQLFTQLNIQLFTQFNIQLFTQFKIQLFTQFKIQLFTEHSTFWGKYLVLQGYSGSVYIILFCMLFNLTTSFTRLNPAYNDFSIL
jgi:hypothetical protein